MKKQISSRRSVTTIVTQVLTALRWWRTLFWFCRITGDRAGEDYALLFEHRDWWNGVIARFCRDYSCGPRKSSLEEISSFIDRHCGDDPEALATLIEWTGWTLKARMDERVAQAGSER